MQTPLRTSLLHVALGSALLLLLPLLAMQFTREVNWTPLDFAVAWLLLSAAGTGVVLALRRWRGMRRVVAVAAVLLAAALLWAELAVGVFH